MCNLVWSTCSELWFSLLKNNLNCREKRNVAWCGAEMEIANFLIKSWLLGDWRHTEQLTAQEKYAKMNR